MKYAKNSKNGFRLQLFLGIRELFWYNTVVIALFAWPAAVLWPQGCPERLVLRIIEEKKEDLV